MNYFVNSLSQPSRAETVIISILLMEKLRIKKMQLLTKSRIDSER